MPLPPDFQFSQANLQDYVDCRRRFQLRYLLRLSWPAVEAEPVQEYETHVRDGEAFHRLIYQHQLGLPIDRLTDMVEAAAGEARGPDEAPGPHPLATWWANYLAAAPADLPARRYPEIMLSAPVGEHRLVAKYDLVAVDPGRRAVIVDWKTSGQRSSQAWFAARLQTRVYRYVLVEAGAHLNAGAEPGREAAPRIRPGQVTMLYWFANFPDRPERLPYDDVQHQADARYLSSLVAQIAAANDDDFWLTDDPQRCRFCPYRSLCARGVEAGQMGEERVDGEPATEVDWAKGFDFEQVAEVAF